MVPGPEGIQCPDSLNPCLDRRPMGGNLVCSGNRGGALDDARSMPLLSSIVSEKCSGGSEPELSTLGPSGWALWLVLLAALACELTDCWEGYHSLKGLARLVVESRVWGLCLLVPFDAKGDAASVI